MDDVVELITFSGHRQSIDLYGDDIFKSHLSGVKERPWVKGERPWYKFYEPNAPRTIDYPEVPLFEICDQASRRFSNHKCIIYLKDGREYFYANLGKISDKLAAALHKDLGVGRGESVAMIMWNSPSTFSAVLESLRRGPHAPPHDKARKRRDASCGY